MRPNTPRQSAIAPRILEALSSIGPMTAPELRELPELAMYSSDTIRKTCDRMIDRDQVHVTEWTHDAEGERTYPRPRYKLGPGKNRRRPDRKTRGRIVGQQQRRSATRKRTNFVFNLGA